MLVYIPSQQNNGLFDTFCNQNGIPIQKQSAKRLSSFAKSSVSNLSHVTVLAIDLSILEDTDSEIITAIEKISAMYSRLRIVIVALEREPGDALLDQIVKAGVSNIITNHTADSTTKAVERCMLGDGIPPLDAVRTYITASEPIAVEQECPTPPPLKPAAAPAPPLKRVSVTQQEPQPRHIFTPKAPINQIQRRRHHRSINIGLCGTQRKIGTTHVALMLCAYLRGIGCRAAYMEYNEHDSIAMLERIYSVNSNVNIGLRQYAGIDMFSGYSLPVVMALKYDFYIFDYGTYQEVDAKEFLHNDIQIIVGGSKAWEMPYYMYLFEEFDGYDDLNFIINFSPEHEHEMIVELMEGYGDKTYFSRYAPDPFCLGENAMMFEDILHPYLE